MAVRIFITGGTFDKEYNELTGQLFFNDTHMHDLLELGRCKVPVETRTLMMVDSLEMTDETFAEQQRLRHEKKVFDDRIIEFFRRDADSL